MMISGYLKHIRWALLSLAAFSLAGCASEPEAPESVDSSEEIILRLKIASPTKGSYSRADDDVIYENPENTHFEQISSLRVIIINEIDDVTETGHVEANRLVRTDAFGNPQYDNLRFRVVADQWKRIYLIANESSLTAPVPPQGQAPQFETATQFLDSYVADTQVSLSDLIDWTVAMPEPEEEGAASTGLFYPASGYTQIPLTESFDIFVERTIHDNATGQLEDYTDTDLFLTRAAAKASFYINPASSRDYTITALSLSGVGTKEYVFPLSTEYDPAKYDENKQVNVVTNSERYITTFETPSPADTTTFLVDGLTFDLKKEIPAGATESVYLTGSRMYFPESILQQGKHYKVGVQINGDIWLYADLVTSNTQGAPEVNANILNINGCDAIARDTHLKIDLTILDGKNITCYVQVVPYISVELNPWFGFEEPTPPFTYPDLD